jgi:hypothetical protein
MATYLLLVTRGLEFLAVEEIRSKLKVRIIAFAFVSNVLSER